MVFINLSPHPQNGPLKWAKNELGIKIVPGLKMGQETKNSVLKRGYKWVQG